MTSLRRHPRRGWFITFEGPEGAGKTSQAARLRESALEAGVDVVLTREPGGTVLGERIREILLPLHIPGVTAQPTRPIDARTDALLFNAARAQLVAEVVEPALSSGRLVIATRFADSTLAYQGHGQGLPLDELRALERFATSGCKPDLTILLDLPPEVGLGRKARREHNRFESSFDLEFHRRVRNGFLALAREEPARFAVIDATRSADEVFADVLAATGRLPDLGLVPPVEKGRRGAVAHTPSEPEARKVRIQR